MAYINGQKILNVEMTGLVNIDTEMSDTSENPVQNKVVKEYVDEKFNNADGGITIDQIYNPESENAQSGKAVADALGNIETALDGIIAIQNELIGGENV